MSDNELKESTKESMKESMKESIKEATEEFITNDEESITKDEESITKDEESITNDEESLKELKEESPYTILKNYLATLTAGPEQRTTEWYKIKKLTVGGSEMSCVLNKNPYKDYHEFIAEKTGIGEKCEGNLATRWGTLFENITERWTQNILCMSEICAAPSIEGVIARQRYSPDGLGIVRFDGVDYIILFEFKSPLSSLPDGKIPYHYMTQVQTGLLTIAIADCAIYVSNAYRKCALSQLSFNGEYDTAFHSNDKSLSKKKIHNTIPYATGLICFYQTSEDYDKYCAATNQIEEIVNHDLTHENEKHEEHEEHEEKLDEQTDEKSTFQYQEIDYEILVESKNKMIDFGSANDGIMNRMLELWDAKIIKHKYCAMCFNQPLIDTIPIVQDNENFHRERVMKNPLKVAKKQIEDFEIQCNQENLYPVGFMPWKLLLTDIIISERDDNWRSVIEEPVLTALRHMDEIYAAADPNAKYNEIFNKESAEKMYGLDMDFSK